MPARAASERLSQRATGVHRVRGRIRPGLGHTPGAARGSRQQADHELADMAELQDDVVTIARSALQIVREQAAADDVDIHNELNSVRALLPVE